MILFVILYLHFFIIGLVLITYYLLKDKLLNKVLAYKNLNGNKDVLYDVLDENDWKEIFVKQNQRLSTRYKVSDQVSDNDIDIFGISLPKRKKSHFQLLVHDLAKEDLSINYMEGINGKLIDLDNLPDIISLQESYITSFRNNDKEFEEGKTKNNYRGHLGCTLTHIDLIKNMIGTDKLRLIMEDDAIITENFKSKLNHYINELNKYVDWDIFVLGFCCDYKDHNNCTKNDPVEHVITSNGEMTGLIRLKYYFGGWSYVVNKGSSASKIIDLIEGEGGLSWHSDLTLARFALEDKLNIYGVIPMLSNHPGFFRFSSFDYYQYGSLSRAKTDTNR